MLSSQNPNLTCEIVALQMTPVDNLADVKRHLPHIDVNTSSDETVLVSFSWMAHIFWTVLLYVWSTFKKSPILLQNDRRLKCKTQCLKITVSWPLPAKYIFEDGNVLRIIFFFKFYIFNHYFFFQYAEHFEMNHFIKASTFWWFWPRQSFHKPNHTGLVGGQACIGSLFSHYLFNFLWDASSDPSDMTFWPIIWLVSRALNQEGISMFYCIVRCWVLFNQLLQVRITF